MKDLGRRDNRGLHGSPLCRRRPWRVLRLFLALCCMPALTGSVFAQEAEEDAAVIPYEVLRAEALSTFSFGKSEGTQGSGKLESGKFNSSISVRFDATDAQLDLLKNQFQRASELLYDATDGQHQFGEILVCDDSRGGDNADIWILENGSPAGCSDGVDDDGDGAIDEERPDGVDNDGDGAIDEDNACGRSYVPGGCVPGLGDDDCRVMLYYDNALAPSNGNADGAHVIVHEWGHYAYGIFDEYVNNTGGTAICVAPDSSGSFPHDGSLMENFWLRSITEFCVDSTHDGDNPTTATDESDDTRQHAQRMESSWETMKRFFSGLTVPAGLPDAGPTSGADDIEWRVLEPETRLMLIIDRSGSMNAGTRIEDARTGAKLFTDLTTDGDKLGVASFSSSGRVDFALAEVNAAAKTAAKSAIDGISAGGLTNIGGGLRVGMNQIIAPGDTACQQVMILLTDGGHNTGENPLNVIPDLKSNGVIVHAIALGTAGNTALLREVAEQTGGQFFFVADSGDLPAVFATLQTATTDNGGLITAALAPLNAGEVGQQSVLVEEGTTEATFVVSWDGAANIDLTLVSPSGVVITPSTAASDPDIDFASDAMSEFYRVRAPEAGTWTMEFEAVSASGTVEVQAQASGVNPGITFDAAPDQISYTFPEQVHIVASPQAPVHVTGASVAGQVTRPDGSTVPITLFDDGAHDDGVYGAFFNSYSGDGGYTFEIVASTVDGVAKQAGARLFSGEGLFVFPLIGFIPPEGPSSTPAPSFERTETFGVNVLGVPANLPPTADAGPDQTVECAASTGTPVTLDGSGSSDPDGDALTFSWAGPFPEGGGTVSGVSPTVTLPLGTHAITLTVSDGNGGSDTDVVEISVGDTTPPGLTVQNVPITLWPPNHKYETITLGQVVTGVSDICDAGIDLGNVVITSASSDEPENANGDGNTVEDIVLSAGCDSVDLRAERQGGGNGRVYTLALGVADASGNVGTATFAVQVPHSRKDTALDDGAAYSVAGCVPARSVPKDADGADARTEPATPQTVIPDTFVLEANYPNPFNPKTTIRFGLPEAAPVRLVVYDMLGRLVRVLLSGTHTAGTHEVVFDASDLSSGTYLYRLETPHGSFTQTMQLVK